MYAVYEVFISILACVAVAFSIIDLNTGLSPFLMLCDNAILFIFIVDYFARLLYAKNKREFFKNNIFDLIAIIPFSSAFRIFRIAKLAKLARLSKLTKLSRFFAFSFRLIGKLKVFLNTNGFKYMLFITSFFVVVGGIAIHFAEGMSFADGIWWAFVTATTVGYGDISPSTSLGRFIAMALMLVGIGLIGSLTSTITSYFVNNSSGKKDVADETLENLISRISDIKSLSDEDIDNICKILKTLNK